MTEVSHGSHGSQGMEGVGEGNYRIGEPCIRCVCGTATSFAVGAMPDSEVDIGSDDTECYLFAKVGPCSYPLVVV